MKDPIMRLIPITDQSWKIITESLWSITWPNNTMWFCGMNDLGSEMKSSGTNTNLGKSTLGSRVGIGSIIGSKSKNWDLHSLPNNGMWLSKIGDSVSRFMGTKINAGSENWSKLGNVPELT